MVESGKEVERLLFAFFFFFFETFLFALVGEGDKRIFAGFFLVAKDEGEVRISRCRHVDIDVATAGDSFYVGRTIGVNFAVPERIDFLVGVVA